MCDPRVQFALYELGETDQPARGPRSLAVADFLGDIARFFGRRPGGDRVAFTRNRGKRLYTQGFTQSGFVAVLPSERDRVSEVGPRDLDVERGDTTARGQRSREQRGVADFLRHHPGQLGLIQALPISRYRGQLSPIGKCASIQRWGYIGVTLF